MLSSQNAAPKCGDVSRRTLRVIDIIASWTVNTFYNYLHEEAVTRHSQGRAGSITDGYRQMVKAYLDTFAHQEGYIKIVNSLHKYYCDAEKMAMLAIDEWIREILGEFIPDDYKSIMTNIQRYDTLRKILINAIEQFSSVVIQTPMFDILISNHDEPSLVLDMKKTMRGLLLAERQDMFMRIHRASTNSDPSVNATSSMKAEIYRLAEENVLLKSKNGKLVTQVKKAIDGMKARDRVINTLNGDLRKSQEKMMHLQVQLANGGDQSGFSNISAILPPPKTPADDFKSSLDGVASYHGFPVLRPAIEDRVSRLGNATQAHLGNATAPRMAAPVESQSQKMQSSIATRYDSAASPSQNGHGRSYDSIDPGHIVRPAAMSAAVPIPLTHVEDAPEPFAMADPVEDDIAEVAAPESYVPHGEPDATGSDTLALNMDEFMNS